jgi:hypothetical protein
MSFTRLTHVLEVCSFYQVTQKIKEKFMKFQLKVLAAALALSATVLPAQAAISTATTGDSSMVLTLIDFADGISSVYNLGYTYSQFDSMVSAASAAGGALTWDVSALYGATWSNFWSTAQAGSTSWAIYAADGTGSGLGARGMIMTKGNVMSTSNTNLSLGQNLQQSIANMDTYLDANKAIDSSYSTTGKADYAGATKAYGATGRVNAAGYDSTNPLDTSMEVLSLTLGKSNFVAPITTTLGNTQGNYSFSMSSAGVLSFNVPVAPVPEADSYAMLLAGLGVVAAVTRRRKA